MKKGIIAVVTGVALVLVLVPVTVAVATPAPRATSVPRAIPIIPLVQATPVVVPVAATPVVNLPSADQPGDNGGYDGRPQTSYVATTTAEKNGTLNTDATDTGPGVKQYTDPSSAMNGTYDGVSQTAYVATHNAEVSPQDVASYEAQLAESGCEAREVLCGPNVPGR